MREELRNLSYDIAVSSEKTLLGILHLRFYLFNLFILYNMSYSVICFVGEIRTKI